ncbi:MAG: dihydroxyacetone kinase subunit L [Niameybacter sp.]
MKKDQWKAALLYSTEYMCQAKEELTEIDAKFGDADHGVTMEKVSYCIQETLDSHDFQSIKTMMEAVGNAIMKLNGGASVPLWATYLGGFAIAFQDETNITEKEVQEMFQNALEEIQDLTTARVGDKTMMDTLIPATAYIVEAQGTIEEILKHGAEGARLGMETTKQCIAKFGRAKNYKMQTIGTPDVGAVSAMYFFEGLYKGLHIK